MAEMDDTQHAGKQRCVILSHAIQEELEEWVAASLRIVTRTIYNAMATEEISKNS